MGAAKRRGNFEERKAEAIRNGRINKQSELLVQGGVWSELPELVRSLFGDRTPEFSFTEGTPEQLRDCVKELKFSTAIESEIFSAPEFFVLRVTCGDEHAFTVGIPVFDNGTFDSKLWSVANAPWAKNKNTFHRLVNYAFLARMQQSVEQIDSLMESAKAAGFTVFDSRRQAIAVGNEAFSAV